VATSSMKSPGKLHEACFSKFEVYSTIFLVLAFSSQDLEASQGLSAGELMSFGIFLLAVLGIFAAVMRCQHSCFRENIQRGREDLEKFTNDRLKKFETSSLASFGQLKEEIKECFADLEKANSSNWRRLEQDNASKFQGFENSASEFRKEWTGFRERISGQLKALEDANTNKWNEFERANSSHIDTIEKKTKEELDKSRSALASKVEKDFESTQSRMHASLDGMRNDLEKATKQNEKSVKTEVLRIRRDLQETEARLSHQGLGKIPEIIEKHVKVLEYEVQLEDSELLTEASKIRVASALESIDSLLKKSDTLSDSTLLLRISEVLSKLPSSHGVQVAVVKATIAKLKE
jgi:hypothetical protein